MTPAIAGSAPHPQPRLRTARARQIVESARAILEAEGTEGLTMRRVGDAVGIRAASLYKHFSGKGALELALVEEAFDEMGSTLHRAVDDAPTDPVGPLLEAYRTMGTAHPNLYRLVTAGTLPRGAILPGLEEWAGEPFFRAVGEPHLAQALWAFAHGTMVLELDRRFVDGSDLTKTWAAGARAFRAGREEPPHT